MARIFSLGICWLLLLSLFSWPEPVLAGGSVWSAETIPTTLNNVLGPVGVDVRCLALHEATQTIYAAPGDSIVANVIYKSFDNGVTWTTMNTTIRANFIAVAPDDPNLVVITSGVPAAVHLSINGGVTWQDMGNVQEIPGGGAAAGIYSVAISPIRNSIQYIAVSGYEAGLVGNLWYYDYGALFPQWHETNDLDGIAPNMMTIALAFSPDFVLDETLAVVTANNTIGFNLELFSFSSLKWNDAASYTDFPCEIVSSAAFTDLNSASLTLSPTFTANDLDNSYAFVGLAIVNGATSSGIYRFRGATKTAILLNFNIHSVFYNGGDLLAGAYDTNRVYRSIAPLAVIPGFSTSTTLKSPGGNRFTLVMRNNAGVITGTSGNESAFSFSTDNGANFDDISLIDTTIANARDVEVYKTGSKVYLVTDNGTNTSLWRWATNWKRVLCLQGTTDYIVRTDTSSASVIYLAKKGGTTIYYNNGSGSAAWTPRACTIGIQDLTVESGDVIYVLNNTGSVVKSISSGNSWGTVTPTTLATGATIVSAGTNILLVGSADGYVAYSLTGSANFTMIPEAIGVVAGNIQVIPDQYFSTNKKIYAASSVPGQNIVTWTIGSSTTWTDIFNGVIPGGVYGLAITEDILYALEYNPGTGQSTLWRHISPASAITSSAEWNASTTTANTDIDDVNVQLSATPRALKASTGKVWAVKTNGVNKLYSYTDVIVDVSIDLMGPIQGSMVRVNSLNGIAADVMFSWERPTVATEYELFIAYDEDFFFPAATITVTMNNTVAYVLVGPQQVGPAHLDFNPGTFYYWKIRITKPGYSQYSIARYFTIEQLIDASALAMVAGQNGMVTGTNPTLSWQPLQGVTEYQFRLSDNPEMTAPILDAKVNTLAIHINITLEYGKTYFWQVRASKPNEGNWSALVNFTVAEQPTEPEPPVIIEKVPPISVIIPAPPQDTSILLQQYTVTSTEVTPAYFHAIIFAMAVLLVVVSVIIFGPSTKRLLAVATRPKRPPVTPRKRKTPVAKPIVPEVKPETVKEETKKSEFPEKEVALPPTIDKSKEGAAVIFAAKSFIWMLAEEKATDETKAGLLEKERQSLGNKLAIRIKDLTRRANLYIKHPEDAAMLLHIWAQYGSREETNRYLAKSFANMPDNAIRLLKCYLPAEQPDKPPPSADDFTMTQYKSIAEVVDPDKVYAALAKVFKFKVSAIEEKIPIKPAERNLAFKFMRLQLQTKSGR